MSDRDESTKKDRLINAWIAVGPDGKTTDVSEVADSSRGYASDIRRALESEGEGEEDALSEEEIREAYDPELVEQYRDELDDDAIGGEWSFVETLRETDEAESATDATDEEPSGIDRGTERTPTSAAGEQQSQPSSGGPPSRPEDSSRSREQARPGGEGGRARTQHPRDEPGPPSQQPSPPQGGGGETGRRPPGRQPSPQQPPGQGHQPPGPGQGQQSSGPGQQSPQRSRGPPQGPRQAPQQTPPHHPSQQGTQQPSQQAPPPGAGQPPQPQSQPQQEPGSIQQVIDELSGVDEALAVRQQRAEREVQSLPPESQARSIAISKHNLIVEVRQSLDDILGRL